MTVHKIVLLSDIHIGINTPVNWYQQSVHEPYAIHTDPSVRPSGYDFRDNFGPFTVPENELFMMGDNRDNSNDSRYWGPLDMELVKGRAMFLYWSWDAERNWPRWNRIFSPIR